MIFSFSIQFICLEWFYWFKIFSCLLFKCIWRYSNINKRNNW